MHVYVCAGGDICVCHNDKVKGHWTGASCQQCIVGWRAPTCTDCDTDYVGGGHCSIPCVENQGVHRQQGDNPDPSDTASQLLPLRPAFRCYSLSGGGRVTAWFGHDNRNAFNVYVSAGSENRLGGEVEVVTTLKGSGTQPPSKFVPGLVHYAMSVQLAVNATDVWWYVAYSPSNMVVNASFSLPGNEAFVCPQPPVLTPAVHQGTHSGFCQCLPGYWGPACQHACPGGAATPCHGNGRCDSSTGLCQCYAGVKGGDNCSACEAGRLGTDCSVALLDSAALAEGGRVASGYGSGHFVTFDGALYDYQGVGEHMMLDSTLPPGGLRLRLHGRLVMSANSGAVLCQAVAVSVGTQLLELQAAASGVLAAHNGKPLSLLELPTTLAPGVRLHLVESRHVRVQAGEATSISLYLREVGIDVEVRASVSVCNASRGLFSSCNQSASPADDFVTKTGAVLTHHTQPSLNQRSIHTVFGPSWSVAQPDSLFRFIPVAPATPGYGLRFNHSHAVSERLFIFTRDDTAVEMRFQLEGGTADCQTLWSYSAASSTDMSVGVCHSTLVVVRGPVQETTPLRVEASMWYHLTLNWASRASRLSVVLVRDEVTLSSTIINVDSDTRFFANGGTLMIGQRHLHGARVQGYQWSLRGTVDDVRIWKRTLTISEIRQRLKMYRIVDPSLTCSWRLEEGYGEVSVDVVAGIRLTFAEDPWWHPAWSEADFAYTLPALSSYNIYSTEDVSPNKTYSAFCRDHVYSSSINTSCGYLGAAALQAFFQQCLFNSLRFRTTAAAMEVMVTLANVCRHLSQQSSLPWPARSFCGDFPDRPFPEWTGNSCSHRCLSGRWSQHGCVCLHGFYGDACHLTCPLSPVGVCGGGTCDKGGNCLCSLNTRQDTTCSRCAEGWAGSDCSVAVVTDAARSGDQRVCMVYGFSHVIMFDGQAFNFDTAGQFTLVETGGVGFHVQILPCPGNRAVCVTALWISTPGANLTLASQTEGLALWHDGVEVDGNSVHLSDLNLTLTRFSPTSVDVTVGGHMTVNVILQEVLMMLTFTLHTSQCATSVGLCGNCDGNKDNDFVGIEGAVALTSVNVTFINTKVAQRWSLADRNSTEFIYAADSASTHRNPSHDGFALRFNGSSAYTGNLGAVNDSSNITLEVKIRPDQSETGTVLRYVAGTEMSVAVNNSVLVLWVNGVQFSTAVTVTQREVQHLAVIVQPAGRTVTLYLLSPHGALQSAVIAVNHPVRLGGGQLYVGGNDVTATYFTGMVDEVRVWRRGLTVYQVLQTSKVRVTGHFADLVAVWSMNEGQGRVSNDSVSHLELYLPVTDVAWVLSRVRWGPGEDVRYYARHSLTPERAGTGCDRLRTDAAMVEACRGLGAPLHHFAFRACVGDVGAAHTPAVFTADTAAYVVYCMRVLTPPMPPTAAICQNRQDPLYTRLCTLACKFGETKEDGACRCRRGYWGYDCSNACPGGVTTPCSGHGLCNGTSGVCECQPRWAADSQCSRCLRGWSGGDCGVFTPSLNHTLLSPTSLQVCSVFGVSHAVTLSQATFGLQQAGHFHLLNATGVDVQARVTYCQEAVLCVTAVGFQSASDSVLIRAGFTDDDLAGIWINGKPVPSPDPATISSSLASLTVRWEATHEYMLSDVRQLLSVKVRTQQRRVTVTLTVNTTLCPDPDACGLCGYNRTDSSTPPYSSWRVSPHRSLFSPLFLNSPYGETAIISPAVFALQIREAGISSQILPDVFPPGKDLTLAVLVKPEEPSGVIVSYGRVSQFGLMYDGSVKVVINGTTHDTGLSVIVGTWNELVIVYIAALHRFDLYIHNTNNMILTHHVDVSVRFIFDTDGVMTLGGWTRGERSWSVGGVRGFRGQVDEARVWHRAVTQAEVSASWQSQRLFSTPGVFAHWTFNEGQGTVCVDRVHRRIFSFFPFDWTLFRPVWRLSDLRSPLPLIPSSRLFTDADLLREAETQCRSVVYSAEFKSRCGGWSEAFVAYYYAVCLSDVAAVRSVSLSLSVMLSMTDRCQSILALPTWPGQRLCRFFDSFPGFGGPACSLDCRFGMVRREGGPSGDSDAALSWRCQCRSGFWGAQCGTTCPGGVANPCSRHGDCDSQSGRCVCATGWAGGNCSVCASGWHGSDCAIAVHTTPTPTPSHYCSLTANSHLLTLDHAGVTFTQAGIFRLFGDTTLTLTVDMLTQPCLKFRSCVVQTAVRVSDTYLLIDALNTTHITINGASRSISRSLSLTSGVKLVALDRLNLELQHPSGLRLAVALREAYLDLQLTLTSSTCSEVTGLCGRCSPDTSIGCDGNNSTCLLRAAGMAAYVRTHPTTPSSVIQVYLTSWRRSFKDSVFAGAVSPSSLSVPTSLVVDLHGGYLVSAPWPSAYLPSPDVTLAVSLKISPRSNLTSAVVWTYAERDVFGVLVRDGRLALYHKGGVVPTTLTVRVNVWSSVCLVYSRRTGVAVVHYVWTEEGGRGVVGVHQAVSVGRRAWPAGGTLALAVWQIPLVPSPRPETTPLYCQVHHVMVWTIALTPDQVVTSWRHLRLTPVPGLAMGWLINGGSGGETSDLVHGHRLSLSERGVSWVHADVAVDINVHREMSPTLSVYRNAMSTCAALFGRAAIQGPCGGLSSSLSLFTSVCVQDVVTGQASTWAMTSVLTFASECQNILGTSSWPGQGLCNAFPSRHFPVYVGEQCNKRCTFGEFDEGTQTCSCLSGFWGETCDHRCPGDEGKPVCHAHGECDKDTGRCGCQPQWQGDDQCGSCTAGFTGTDCSVTEPPSPPRAHPAPCFLHSGGLLGMFSDYTVTEMTRQFGSYFLFMLNQFSIQVELVQCPEPNADKPCINSVSVSLHAQSVSVSMVSSGVAGVAVNGEWRDSSVTQSVSAGGCNLTVRQTDSFTHSVAIPQMALHMSVVSYGRHLGVVFRVSPQVCCAAGVGGLCGQCSQCPTSSEPLPCGLSEGDPPFTAPPAMAVGAQDDTDSIQGKVDTMKVPANVTTGERTLSDGSGAGKMIQFNDSSAITEPLKHIDYLRSIEFLFRMCSSSQTVCGGVIFSYATANESLTVRVDSTLFVDRYDTGLVVTNDTWYLLTLTYDVETKLLTVYLVRGAGAVERREVGVTGPVPRGGGRLSLGKWIPNEVSDRDQPKKGFTGAIDELRIWNKYIDNTEVGDHWDHNYLGNETHLAYLWKFDQLQSSSPTSPTDASIIRDAVRQHPLSLPLPPFPSPSLVFSSAPIPFRPSSQSVVLPPQPASSASRRRRQTVTGISASAYTTCENIFVSSQLGRACVNASGAVQTQYLFQCYLALQRSGQVSSSQESIVGYSTFCQQVLGLPTWPAQSLCTDQPLVAAVTVIRNLCGSPCHFGTKPPSNTTYCQCNHGYWGAACNLTCPGGAQNACSGFGTCDQWTGACACPLHRRDDSCSSCSPGWVGHRCEVSETPVASGNASFLHNAWLHPLGHVLNADGLGFYVNSPGVYSLLAMWDRVQLQGKLIRCFENFTCATFLSVMVGDSNAGYARITVQSPSRPDGKPPVYISNASASVDTEVNFHGVTVSRTTLTQVLVSVRGGVEVTVGSCGVYLTAGVSVPGRYLNATSGLLSGSGWDASQQKLQHLHSLHHAPRLNLCRGGVSEQSPLSARSSASVLTGVSAISLTPRGNSTLDLSSLVVPDCEVSVHFPTDHHRRQQSSGFALSLGESAVFTNFSMPSATSNVTVEVMVRHLGGSGERQVVLSFTHRDFVAVYLWNSTLYVEASTPTNTSSFSTGMAVNQGRWNKLVVTYHGATGRLTLYHFNATAWIERRDFLIQPGLFSTPGVLAVGSWQPPLDGAPHGRIYPWRGEVENVLVWSRLLEPNLVPDLWLMDPLVARPALTFAWTLDEGQGHRTRDVVGEELLHLPAPPLTSPEWVASDVDYVLTRGGARGVELTLAVLMSSPQTHACHSVVARLSSGVCQSVSQATTQDLHALCVYTLSVVHYPPAALNTMLAYTALCARSPSPPPSLLPMVCEAASEWRELAACSPDCVFGVAPVSNSSGQCVCGAGYFGPRCASLCPGGSGSACSGHGACGGGGACVCHPHWAGSPACSRCSTGYTGTDCSIFTTPPLTSRGQAVAMVTPTGDVVTFSGLHLALSGLRGAYTVFRHASAPQAEVQVLLVSCSYGSCSAAVAFTFQAYNVTVLPSPHSALPAVYVNGSQLSLPRKYTFPPSLTLTMTSVDSLTFSLGGSVEVGVTTQGAYLDVRVKTSLAICGASGGVLDTCQPLTQSVYTPVSSQSARTLQGKVETDFKVSDSEGLFQLSERDPFSSSATSYALSFNGTSAWSGPIRVNSSTGLKDYTLSLHVKPQSYGGTLLSLGKNVSLTLTNDAPMKVVCGSSVLNTGLNLTLHRWNQLLVTMAASEGKIHVMVYSENATIQHTALPHQCLYTVRDGAVMSLGEWVPSPDDPARRLARWFVGQADEFVMWSPAIPPAVVYQVYNMDVDVAAFRPILASLITLDEGVGTVAHDNLLSSNNLLLPPPPGPLLSGSCLTFSSERRPLEKVGASRWMQRG
ncbi:hypothetical protein ACOMHN_056886 [Nucella lapillus]